MFIQKKSFNFFISSFLVFLISFFLNFNNYIGNKFIFFIFQLSSFALFIIATKRNNSAFEFFTYSFFLLSFWFKFNCILYFENIKVTEGDFDLKISNYDDATFIVIVVFLACISANFIKKLIFKKYIKENKYEMKNEFIMFYRRNRIFIIFFFLGLLIMIWVTNFYFKIYSKGLVNEHIPLVVKYFYSWNLTYGLSVLISLLIYIDFLIFKNSRIFILGIIEAFFTQINIHSRSFLLSFSAYLRGFLLLPNIKNLPFSKLTIAKIVFTVLILFFLSIYSVTKLRSNQFYDYGKTQTSISLLSTFDSIFFLSVNRWVGIDALLAVTQNKNINFKFFLSAWHEKKDVKKKSFYVKNFFNSFEISKFKKENVNIVITPGIVAFLFYSGSALFVFFAIFILILIFSAIESLFYYYSMRNIILANIIGYALAIRLIHFGYVPINTVDFLFSFFITFVFIFIFKNLTCKKI